jgi:TRAP-type C4-dicarboxylate transport system permease small subunit
MGCHQISTTPETSDLIPPARDWAFPLRVIVGAIFSCIVILTIAQIFFRFVLNSPLVWSEELVRLMVVWMTFLGAAVLCWDGRHLAVDVLFVRLSDGPKRILRIFNCTVALGFLGILVWYSIPLVELTRHVSIGALDLPEAAYRVPATIGGGLMIVFVVLRIALRWPRRGKPTSGRVNDSVM